MLTGTILWVLGYLLQGVLVWRGVRERMLGRYPFFYSYLAVMIGVSLVRTAALLFWGLRSSQYYYAYHLPNLAMPGLQLLILLHLYMQISGRSEKSRRNLILPIVFALLLSVPVVIAVIWNTQGLAIDRYQLAALTFQLVVCILICHALVTQKSVLLGRNVKALISGFGMLVGLQAFNFSRFLLEEATYTEFSFFVQFFYVSALIVLVWGMWDYDPVTDRVPGGETAEVNERLKEVLKTLQELR